MATRVFKKIISIQFDHTTYPSDTVNSLVRTYSDVVVAIDGVTFDPTQISVFYNGQEIGTDSTSRYYSSVVPVPGSGTPTGFTISLHGNSSYVWPGYVTSDGGYTGPTSVNCLIEPSDVFFVDYTHTVTS